MLRKKILLIDDSSFFANHIRDILSEANYDFVYADSGMEGIKMVRSEKPDLVLLDIIMPDMNGFEVCKVLRQSDSNNMMPIIMLTSSDNEDDKLVGLELGADDYMIKPFNKRELLSRVKNTIKRIERNRSANPLTGLRGNIEIKAELISKIENRVPFALIYADIDNFKAYNDAYGFSKGDRVIIIIADILSDQVRVSGGSDDFIGHIGGDDFVIITKPVYADEICSGVISEFDRRIREFYKEDDLKNGTISTFDRMGEKAEFPIMTISLAVIDNEDCNLDSYNQVAELAADLKTKVKAIPGSTFIKYAVKEHTAK